jgi:uncharacterized membrane protein
MEKPPHLAVQVAPFAIIAAGALWLARHYYELPERMPVHWNWRGDADTYLPRTAFAAALPLLLGLAVTLLLVVMQAGLRRSAPPEPMREGTLRVMLAAEYLVAVLCCGVLATSASSGRFLWLLLAATFAGVVVVLVLAIRATRGVPKAVPRNPAAWRAGFLYVDREDPALFVPKRAGYGYTFNFGRPLAVVLVLALLVAPLLVATIALSAR